jgi:hypothetical protein
MWVKGTPAMVAAGFIQERWQAKDIPIGVAVKSVGASACAKEAEGRKQKAESRRHKNVNARNNLQCTIEFVIFFMFLRFKVNNSAKIVISD